MRKFLLLLVCFLPPAFLLAQDKICTMDGDCIAVLVTEITDKTISYKKWSNLDGPVHKIKRGFVARIEYKNGSIEYYAQTPPQQQVSRQAEPVEDVVPQTQTQTRQVQQPQSQARQDERVIMHRGKLYFASGRKLNEYERSVYFGNMLKDYERQQNKYVRGEILVSAGSVLAVVGAIAGLAADDPSAGIGLLAGGLVLDVVAIPLLVIGNKKRTEIYQRRAAQGGYVPPSAQLTLGSQHYGVGVALKF